MSDGYFLRVTSTNKKADKTNITAKMINKQREETSRITNVKRAKAWISVHFLIFAS